VSNKAVRSKADVLQGTSTWWSFRRWIRSGRYTATPLPRASSRVGTGCSRN